MELFKHDSKVDFMGLRYWAALFSILISLWSISGLIYKGLNWGLEFTGGTQIQVSFPSAANVEAVRESMVGAGYQDPIVQTYGVASDVLIRIGANNNVTQKKLTETIEKLFPTGKILSYNDIGAQVGKELATNGALALFLALLGTGIYIAFRFEYRLAISAALSLIHDPIVILGIFAWTQMEFDLISLAAILTVVGYSLNDTIVVFDRVRENFRKIRKATASEIINLSVNQTLSRTIITSGLTLLSMVSVFFFGGEKLHGFATALIIGIVVGTYSSIYVVGTLSVWFGLNRNDLLPPTREAIDERP